MFSGAEIRSYFVCSQGPKFGPFLKGINVDLDTIIFLYKKKIPQNERSPLLLVLCDGWIENPSQGSLFGIRSLQSDDVDREEQFSICFSHK